MGKMVHTKEDYLKNMKDMNLIPSKEADSMARSKSEHKPYDKPSEDAMRFMTHISKKKSKGGKIKLSGREVNEMKRLGVHFERAGEHDGGWG